MEAPVAADAAAMIARVVFDILMAMEDRRRRRRRRGGDGEGGGWHQSAGWA